MMADLLPNPADLGDSVVLQNPHGELETISKQEAQKALLPEEHGGGGYSMADPERILHADKLEKASGPGQGLITGLESALSAGTFGASTGFETASGLRTPEEIRIGKEAHPYMSGLGSVVGLAASNAIPGLGEVADVSEAIKGASEAKSLLKAGEITAEDAAPFLDAAKSAKENINPLSAQSIMSGTAERAANAMGIQNPIAGGAAKMAIESALFQGGDEFSKMFSEDPDQTVGSAAANIGLAGLIGAPLGGISGLMEASPIGGKLSQMIEDYKGRVKEHLQNPDPLSALHSELKDFTNINEEGLDVYGDKGLKAQAIEKLMPEQLNDKMFEHGQGILAKAKALSQNMQQNPDLYPRYYASAFDRDLRVLTENLSQPEPKPSEVFNSIQDFKQRLGEILPKKGEMIGPADREFVKSGRDLYGGIRKGLEDTDAWGKAGAVQKDINKAFSDYLPALKDFKSKFMSKVAGTHDLDMGKLQTYINQTGKAGQKVKQEMLGNFIEKSEAFRNTVNDVYSKIGQESPIPTSSLAYTKSTLDELTPGARLADTMIKKGLSKLGGEAIGTGVGAGVGHAFGAGWIGALIGEHALAPFFSSILPGMIKPFLEKEASASGLKAASDLGLAAVKGASALSRASKNIFKAGEEVLPSRLIPTEKDRSKLNKTLDAYQENPDKMFDIGGPTGHYLPGHASALGQLAGSSMNTLLSMKPKPSKAAPLDQKPVVSKAEQEKYDRALDIAQQPLMVLEHIKNGTLQPQDVQVFNSIYPALHQKLISKLTEDLTNHLAKDREIPYQTRMGLSLFMGQALDSTLTPQGIMAAQSANVHVNAQNAADQPQIRQKHSMNALNKLAQNDMTAAQARESKRLK